jgi:hypothetical protein
VTAYKGEALLGVDAVRECFRDWTLHHGIKEDDYLLFLPRYFQRSEGVVKEWLLSDIPVCLGGSFSNLRLLSDIHGALFEYFRTQLRTRIRTVRVFARTAELAASSRQSLQEAFAG